MGRGQNTPPPAPSQLPIVVGSSVEEQPGSGELIWQRNTAGLLNSLYSRAGATNLKNIFAAWVGGGENGKKEGEQKGKSRFCNLCS